jgi:hypothetical protein
LDVLQAVRDMARGKHDPIAVFYAQNRSVIDKTIVQLEDGLPVELTRMFLKMATGKFDLNALINLLNTAATQELADLNLPNVKTHPSYAPEKFGSPVHASAEELRDFFGRPPALPEESVHGIGLHGLRHVRSDHILQGLYAFLHDLPAFIVSPFHPVAVVRGKRQVQRFLVGMIGVIEHGH